MERIPNLRIGIGKIDIIDRIPAPITTNLPPPVIRGIQPPVVDIPVPRIEYPRIEIPSAEDFDAMGGGSEEKEEEQEEKEREMDDSPAPQPAPPPKPVVPVIPPVPAVPPPPPPAPVIPQKPATTMEVEIGGYQFDVPTPRSIVSAGATAVIGTSATLATAFLFNQGRRALAPVVQDAVNKKFKIKLKQTKPVLHFVREDDKVNIIQYDANGVKVLRDDIGDPEKFLRDQVEIDPLFESSNKIVIDDPIRDLFTREGAERFKYFISPKKMAKKLASRFAF